MWWQKRKAEPTARAITYYRHSAQDRQENSIPIQREQVRKFASEHGIEIVKEFADHGKSGLSTEGRDGFNEALRAVSDPNADFKYVLVLDVSRWGRFQDVDMSAYYRGYCKQHGKAVVYTSMGLEQGNDLFHAVRLSLEGYQAANYSRELSDKVFKGCVKIVQQGFHAGGKPPYGLQRLLLDEQRQPVQFLGPGQHKSIQNQRVTLAPGDESEVGVVRRVFRMFVSRRRSPEEIAGVLNADGITSPGGTQWTEAAVRAVLSNETYSGTMVYNKTSQKLQSPTRRNPKEAWVRTPDAFKGIVEKKTFLNAQKLLDAEHAERRRRYSEEGMLDELRTLLKERGIITQRLVAGRPSMASPVTYAKHFSSLDMAYQQLHADVLQETREVVRKQLQKKVGHLDEYDDYLILDETFSVKIQPAVPVPWGYREYWSFRPDSRLEVDITLGVPLSNSGKYEILGYLFFPRMLVANRGIRLSSASDGRLLLHGHRNLGVIERLLQ